MLQSLLFNCCLLVMIMETVESRSGYFASYLKVNHKNPKKTHFRPSSMQKINQDGSINEMENVLVSLKKEVLAMRNEVLELHDQSAAVLKRLQQLETQKFHKLSNQNRYNMLNNTTSINSKDRKCPDQYEIDIVENKCIKISGERVSWQQAYNLCFVDGAALVSISTSRRQRFITQSANRNPRKYFARTLAPPIHLASSLETEQCDFWIGATKTWEPESSWRWQDGTQLEDTYTNWNPNEPNNSSGSEHCVQMLWLFAWRWNDLPCKKRLACYVCEKAADLIE